jgi:hypothetical protein
VDRTSRTVKTTPKDVKSLLVQGGAKSRSTPGASARTGQSGLGERWQPLTVLAVAGSAFVVFLRKLFR